MNIFIDNKYTRWYFAIIDKAKTCTPLKFYENHHIIPKSLGGSNQNENLVKLTYRQHFICHLLLTKMTVGKSKYQMIRAMYYMRTKTLKQTARSGEEVKRLTSRWFSYVKRTIKETGVPQEVLLKMSKSMIGKNVGKIASNKTRIKMSLAAQNRTASDETKKKISKHIKQQWDNGLRDHIGKKTAETKKKNNVPPPMLGKRHSEETRKKMSISAKLVKHSSPTIETLEKRSKAISLLRWISKDGINRRVKESLLSSFIEDGWIFGVSK